MNRLLTGTALGLMLAMSPALAQDPAQPAPSDTPPAAQPAPAPQPAPGAQPMSPDAADAQKEAADDAAEAKGEAAEAEAEAKEEAADAEAEVKKDNVDAAEDAGAAANMNTANAEFVPAQKAGDWFASDMIGETVTNAQNESVGDINDIILDEKGAIQGAVIGVGGFLGIGEKNVAVQWDSFTVTPQADNDADKVKVQLNVTKETLESAPAYARLDDDAADTAGGAAPDGQAAAPAPAENPASPPAPRP